MYGLFWSGLLNKQKSFLVIQNYLGVFFNIIFTRFSLSDYRADIDGLRAIAVLLVLFFHIEIAFFSGGFIGVDIFFTISGFLITGILLKETSNNNFSFIRFYTRRSLRLLPAYLFLLLVTLFVGVYLLTPLALEDLIKSSIASSLFISNFYFLFEHGGYFSTAAHQLPLLHTWSLSVEEQFYLLNEY